MVRKSHVSEKSIGHDSYVMRHEWLIELTQTLRASFDLGKCTKSVWDGVFTTIENCNLFCLFRLFCIWVFGANVHMVVHSFRPFAAMMAWLVQYHPEVRSLVLHTCIFFRETSFVAPSITYSAFVWTLNELLLRVFWNVLNVNWDLREKCDLNLLT